MVGHVRKSASFKDRIFIHETMKLHISKVSGTELWVYEDDWSDQIILDLANVRVVEEGRTPMTIRSVEYVREEAFGKLLPPQRTGSDEQLKAALEQIATLRAASEAQGTAIGELSNAIMLSAQGYAAMEKRLNVLELAYRHKGGR